MAMEPVEFGFEDLDKQEFKVKVEGRASEKEVEVDVPEEKTPDVEIEIVDDLILDVADIFSKNIGTSKTALILWNYFHSKCDLLYTHVFIYVFRQNWSITYIYSVLSRVNQHTKTSRR